MGDYSEIGLRNKFLEDSKKRYEKKSTDKDALKPKPNSIENILKDVVEIPGKLSMSGPIGTTSVRPKKVNDENPVGGNGKQMVKDQPAMVN